GLGYFPVSIRWDWGQNSCPHLWVHYIERNYLFPFVVVNTLFWGDWATGRDQYKKLKKAEMDRMKAKDM
ncbi:MAG: hypothetical protein K2P73_12200, partial [Lachnospiraceae bacterium]|nr:hypothetical protein [Lachnospiraceae bacterium]